MRVTQRCPQVHVITGSHQKGKDAVHVVQEPAIPVEYATIKTLVATGSNVIGDKRNQMKFKVRTTVSEDGE